MQNINVPLLQIFLPYFILTTIDGTYMGSAVQSRADILLSHLSAEQFMPFILCMYISMKPIRWSIPKTKFRAKWHQICEVPVLDLF